jgi:tetratricopeptide (TPR) repeat protein
MSIRFHAVLLLTLVLASVLTAGLSRPPDSPRLDKLKEWMALVEQHEPGRIDLSVETVRAWDRQWLQDVRDDLYLVRLAICATQRLVKGGRCALPGRDVPGTQYLGSHVAARSLKAREWVGVYTFKHLNDLIGLAAEVDRLDINDILKRGGLLHTDVAFHAPPAATWAPRPEVLFLQKTTVGVADGRESGVNQSIDHLEMARRLLDIVTPDPRRDLYTYPERDAMVRAWYRATMALVVGTRGLDHRHKTVSAELFPDDDEVLFLAGAMHELLASSRFQLGVETRRVSRLVLLESERTELLRAEEFFRRALKLNPGHVEARMRLGQVLAQRGRTAEALIELRAAGTASRDPLVSYYAALLIGRADTDLESARAAFQLASSLYPRAQSPRIGLSEVEMRSGNRQGAAQALEPVWARGESASREDDPWSSYSTAAGRSGVALLDSIEAAFPPSSAER